MAIVETLEKVTARLGLERKEILGCDAYASGQTPFLVRWTVARIGRTRLYLHCFLRSDEGEDLHDHPWSFVSLILWGGYVEVTPRGRRRRWPGMLLWRPATFAHRVELLPKSRLLSLMWAQYGPLRFSDGPVPLRPSVSLVWRTDYLRQWGFFTPRGWVYWKTFFAEKGCAGGEAPSITGKATSAEQVSSLRERA